MKNTKARNLEKVELRKVRAEKERKLSLRKHANNVRITMDNYPWEAIVFQNRTFWKAYAENL